MSIETAPALSAQEQAIESGKKVMHVNVTDAYLFNRKGVIHGTQRENCNCDRLRKRYW